MSTDIEHELRRHLADAVGDIDTAPGLLATLQGRARHRARVRRTIGAAMVAAAAGIALFVAVPAVRDDASEVEVVPAPTPTTAPPAPTITVPATPERPSVIVTVRERGRTLVVVDAGTGAVVRTLHRAAAGTAIEDVSLSPDGTTVWFQSRTVDGQCKEGVRTVPLAGGPVVRTSVGRRPDVSPDGRFVAYLDTASKHGGPSHPSPYLCTGALVVRDLRTGAERAWIVATDPTGHLSHPAWSRDGTRIAVSYDGTTDSHPGDWEGQIRVVDLAKEGTLEEASTMVARSRGPLVGPGGEPRPDEPVWLHDGRLAYVRIDNPEENPAAGSRVVVLDGGTERELLAKVPGTLHLHVDATGRHLLAVNVAGTDKAATYRFIALDAEGNAQQLQAGATSADNWGVATDW